MKRRTFLGSGAALVAATIAHRWPEQGLLNPCLSGLSQELQRSSVVQSAWSGIDASRVWDVHVHLIGIGDSDPGVWIHPRMTSLAHPLEYARRLFLLNASCAEKAGQPVDSRYVERLNDLVAGSAPGFKALLLGYDHTYSATGERDLDRSAMHTADRYAQRIAAQFPERFEWAASIHPYRHDCVQALEWAAGHGARAVKWLPPAMGIDPASARCDPFYAAAARLGMALLTHAGEENTVHGAGTGAYGNPLRLRRALDHGVRVIVAHCASTGEDRDLDRGSMSGAVPSFELFARLMDTPRFAGHLFGDISAITQINRSPAVLRRILERTDWHPRLLHGSDYPLPGVLPLISLRRLVDHGFLEAAAVPELKAVRSHNALLFDFVLKRSLHSGSNRFGNAVFHTRDFFVPKPSLAPA